MRKASTLGVLRLWKAHSRTASIRVLLKCVNPQHKVKYKILVASQTVSLFCVPCLKLSGNQWNLTQIIYLLL